jgi:endonuclease-8
MPEGDTVHKIARALRGRIEGEPLARLWLRACGDVAIAAGARVREVAALGKHLLVALVPRSGSGERVLHVHLGISGRWRRVDPGAPALAGERLRLETAKDGFACLRAPVVELLRRVELPAHPVLARLGPDLLGDDLDLDAVLARARRRDPPNVADLLLDQTVACGLGNVYKSELAFLEGVAPRASPRTLDDARLRALYARARELLLANLGGWPRTTTRKVTPAEPWPVGAPRLWVYGRHGRPCLRCGATIAAERLGDGARATYWCPRCQPLR